MKKLKLVTCESGFDLHNGGETFMAWSYEVGAYEVVELIEGDVVFEIDEDNVVAIASSLAYTVNSGSPITVLEVIEDEQ